jgi:hypothetical protein
MKKIASIFMAVAMLLALAAPAMASSTIVGSTVSGDSVEPTNPYSSAFVGEYQQTIIDIELPNNVALVFNPYRLEYSAAGHTTESGDNLILVDKLADQIFSAPVTIVSKSNIQLDVDMEFTVAAGNGSEMEFAASAADYAAITDPGQNVLLQMVYGLVDSANADPSDSAGSKTITLSEDTTLTDLLSADGAEGQTDLTVTIPAGSSTNAKYFGYKFTGKAQTNTSAAGDDPNPYNTQDTIDVGIVFTFLPKANENIQVQGGTFTYLAFAADGTTAIDAIANAGSDAADITVTVPDGQEGTELPTDKTWTLTNVKVNGVAVTGTISDTLTFGTDAKTLTLKKATVWGARATTGVTAGGKYVKVIPVEFTATSDESTAQVKPINCNVRIVYDPQKAAS